LPIWANIHLVQKGRPIMNCIAAFTNAFALMQGVVIIGGFACQL
jgi:hypothetical protein